MIFLKKKKNRHAEELEAKGDLVSAGNYFQQTQVFFFFVFIFIFFSLFLQPRILVVFSRNFNHLKESVVLSRDKTFVFLIYSLFIDPS